MMPEPRTIVAGDRVMLTNGDCVTVLGFERAFASRPRWPRWANRVRAWLLGYVAPWRGVLLVRVSVPPRPGRIDAPKHLMVTHEQIACIVKPPNVEDLH